MNKLELENAPDEAQNDLALAQPPKESAGDTPHVQAGAGAETEGECGCCQQRPCSAPVLSFLFSLIDGIILWAISILRALCGKYKGGYLIGGAEGYLSPRIRLFLSRILLNSEGLRSIYPQINPLPLPNTQCKALLFGPERPSLLLLAPLVHWGRKILKFVKLRSVNHNMKNKELERASVKAQNDQAQLRAEKSENPAQDAGGALAAAPCSALSDRLLGQSDIIGPAPDGWDKIAESNSKSLEELTKK